MRETKFVRDTDANLRGVEKQKIACAKAHFEAIGVDYKVSTDPTLRDLPPAR